MNKVIECDFDKTVDFRECSIRPDIADVIRSQFRIRELYDMQHQVLKCLANADSRRLGSDLILCAPTGSGKTLAYAVPLIQNILTYAVPRLRAIIVAPTQDLATQIFRVLQRIILRLDLRVGLRTGKTLTSAETTDKEGDLDVMIATPGRLKELLITKVVSLRFLKYLVLDESDRLLQESFDGWLPVLLSHLGGPGDTRTDSVPSPGTGRVTGMASLLIEPNMLPFVDHETWSPSQENVRKILVSATQPSDQLKMSNFKLFDPVVIRARSALPRAIVKEGIESTVTRFKVPSSLRETAWIVKDVRMKFAGLLSLLAWGSSGEKQSNPSCDGINEHSPVISMIFTNSVESAHRLSRLLELCSFSLGRRDVVFEMTGDLSAEQRNNVLSLLQDRVSPTERPNQRSYRDSMQTTVLVCSDMFSRGVDVLDVDCVVNYDVPAHARSYLHRAGRTARAGKPGHVMTILEEKQARHFRAMVCEADRGNRSVPTTNLPTAEILAPIEHNFRAALECLQKTLLMEKLNLIPREERLSHTFLESLCPEGVEEQSESKSPAIFPGLEVDSDRVENPSNDVISLHSIAHAQVLRNFGR